MDRKRSGVKGHTKGHSKSGRDRELVLSRVGFKFDSVRLYIKSKDRFVDKYQSNCLKFIIFIYNGSIRISEVE